MTALVKRRPQDAQLVQFGIVLALIICFYVSGIQSRHGIQESTGVRRHAHPARDGHTPHASARGRHYLPALYPQVRSVLNFTHEDTWYAVSAYMDMRPLAYNDSPAVTIVAGGPLDAVSGGSKWYARFFILQTRSVITELECEITQYAPLDQHTSIHAAAAVICKTGKKWQVFKSMSNQGFGVCIIPSRSTFCDQASIVPVGVPPRYPNYPIPWADAYFDTDASNHTSADALVEKEFHAGIGRIAVCVPGVRGDIYATTLRFWLEYYHEIGVDTAYIYMNSPGREFERIAETIVAEQTAGESTHLARLMLLPWCMQVGSSYRCRRGTPRVPLSGPNDFVAQYYGQVLAHQDCLFRSMGTFRWALFVDLDEYITPRRSDLHNLHDLIRDSVRTNQGLAPTELSIRMAWYESCLPSAADNATVPLSSAIDPTKLPQLPRPAWSAARTSIIITKDWGIQKFMCDPMSCDRMAVHYADTQFCDRYPGKSAMWPVYCKEREYLSHQHALVHQSRVYDREHQIKSPKCGHVDGALEVDWSFTNFVIARLSMTTKESGILFSSIDESV